MSKHKQIKQHLCQLHDPRVKIKKVLDLLHILVSLCLFRHFDNPCNSNQPIQTWQPKEGKQIGIPTSSFITAICVHEQFEGEHGKNVE